MGDMGHIWVMWVIHRVMYGFNMGDTGHVLVIYGSCMGQVWVLCWSYMGHTWVMYESTMGDMDHVLVMYGS